MKNIPKKAYTYLPFIILIVVIILFSFVSCLSGSDTNDIEVGIDSEKIGISMDGTSYFVFLSNIESVSLLDTVPDIIPEGSEVLIANTSGNCINIIQTEGVLYFNYSTNEETTECYQQIEKALT